LERHKRSLGLPQEESCFGNKLADVKPDAKAEPAPTLSKYKTYQEREAFKRRCVENLRLNTSHKVGPANPFKDGILDHSAVNRLWKIEQRQLAELAAPAAKAAPKASAPKAAPKAASKKALKALAAKAAPKASALKAAPKKVLKALKAKLPKIRVRPPIAVMKAPSPMVDQVPASKPVSQLAKRVFIVDGVDEHLVPASFTRTVDPSNAHVVVVPTMSAFAEWVTSGFMFRPGSSFANLGRCFMAACLFGLRIATIEWFKRQAPGSSIKLQAMPAMSKTPISLSIDARFAKEHPPTCALLKDAMRLKLSKWKDPVDIGAGYVGAVQTIKTMQDVTALLSSFSVDASQSFGCYSKLTSKVNGLGPSARKRALVPAR
jgi:hypothetical protein